MPLFEYAGLNSEELAEVVNFARGITTGDNKIDDVVREINGHIIEKHAKSSV